MELHHLQNLPQEEVEGEEEKGEKASSQYPQLHLVVVVEGREACHCCRK